MKVLLIASVSVLSLLAPVSASASTRAWTSTALPLPEGTSFSQITGAAIDGSYVVGKGVAAPWQEVTLLWHNGSVESQPLAPAEFAADVNSSGTVLVNSSEGSARRAGVGLNPLPGANYAFAVALNNSGTTVGNSGRGMAIWPGDPADPRPVAGTDDGAHWTVAGIDEQGRVAAWRSGSADEPTLSYVWDEAGERTRLRPLRGHSETRVQGIRNGRVFGFSAEETGRTPPAWSGTCGASLSVPWKARPRPRASPRPATFSVARWRRALSRPVRDLACRGSGRPAAGDRELRRVRGRRVVVRLVLQRGHFHAGSHALRVILLVETLMSSAVFGAGAAAGTLA